MGKSSFKLWPFFLICLFGCSTEHVEEISYRFKGFRGDSQAIVTLGIFRAQEGDEEKAFDYFLKAAKMGNPEAKYYLGERCFSKDDFKGSVGWLEQSAKENHALQYLALVRLAQVHGLGLEVEKNKVKALEYLEKCSIANPKFSDFSDVLRDVESRGLEKTLRDMWAL